MISEDQQDQAALFALGLLDEHERIAVENTRETDDEFCALVDELSESAAAVALAASPEMAVPPASLKARLLARVEQEASGTPVGRFGARRNAWQTWVPWAIAAGAAIFAIIGGLERSRLSSRLAEARVERRESLRQLVVCTLQPPPNGTGQVTASVLWNPSLRRGELIVTQLPPPGPGHDYQLWAVEDGHKDAVNAGLVHVDGAGRARVGFTPTDTAPKPVVAFALSLESAGGSPTNQGPIVLVGKL